jgi:hypothetical protein
LVGCTNNLYLYSADDATVRDTNIIVGKLDVIQSDKNIGKANIRWIAGYQEVLGLS